MGRAFLKSYMGVCLEGAVIVLACIVFSAFAASDTVVLGGGSVVTQVWGYLGEVIFNMLVLVGLVKGADRVVREMFGMGENIALYFLANFCLGISRKGTVSLGCKRFC